MAQKSGESGSVTRNVSGVYIMWTEMMSPALTYRAAVYPHMNRRPIQRKLDGVWPGIGRSASYN